MAQKSKVELARLKDAEATFLAFYGDTTWARSKLRSGTASLTPDSVDYMKREIGRLADAKAHEADVKAQLAAEDLAAKLATNGDTDQ